jgi:2-polyprenyl-3-methyl-5-hydroxy-6-metoxy-1,4-benzoquinol methylase
MPDQPYLLDNAWREGRARLEALEEFLDPGTIALIHRRGIRAGWSCLELGAGGGSIAKWLASRVGATGRVLATDLDTRHLADITGFANVEVRRHDIVSELLSESEFDLVHARLVLEHLRERDEVLRKLVLALKPGGWLLVESVDYASAIAISEFGAREHLHSQTVRLSAFEASGVDVNYGRKLPRALRELGLADIGNEGRVFVVEGRSPGARWFELSMRQLRGRLVGEGRLSDAEVDCMLELFANPDWAAFSPIIMACWGRMKGGGDFAPIGR